MFPIVGTLPIVERNILTIPNKYRAKITWLAVDNPTASSGTFKLYLTVSGVKVGLTPTMTLNAGEFGEEMKELWMDQGNKITALASLVGMTYIISGELHAL